MSRLNNKGQSLVLFIIFVPLVIIMGALIVDLSYAKYNSRKINLIAKLVLDYGLNNIENDPYNEMVNLIYKNDEDIDEYKIDIDSDNKKIDIMISKSTKSFFSSIIGKEIYAQKCIYAGYFNEEEKIIERVDS